jgi:hypothetical protein
MKTKKYFVPFLLCIFVLATSSNAYTYGWSDSTLGTNQYSILVSSSLVDHLTSTYTFNYSVTNNNQGYGVGSSTGFDGFSIPIPTGANVLGSTPPSSYSSGGWWGIRNGFTPSTKQFWGHQWASVYPTGTTATMSITLSNVNVGQSTVLATSFYGFMQPNNNDGYVQDINGGVYQNYTFNLAQGPIAAQPAATPLPAAVWLLGSGLMGLVGLRKKFKA